MTLPPALRYFSAIDATWPAAETWVDGAFRLRRGKGGGGRVSAASAEGPFTLADIDRAATAMREMGQKSLFLIRNGEPALDQMLDEAGYQVKDPVILYAAPCAAVGGQTDGQAHWPPSAAAEAVWACGGIGKGRLGVMARVAGPHAAIELPGGVVFCGVDGDVAMFHALEVLTEMRRQGIGRALVVAAARWAEAQGAAVLSLVVTEANQTARALYASLGFAAVGRYHYRIEPEGQGDGR